MTQSELIERERTVEISPENLARVFPESRLDGTPRRDRSWTAVRCRIRLIMTQFRFRFGTLQPLKCQLVKWRLKGRLLWMRLRHRSKLGGR